MGGAGGGGQFGFEIAARSSCNFLRTRSTVGGKKRDGETHADGGCVTPW
jgi:hypothetical protein